MSSSLTPAERLRRDAEDAAAAVARLRAGCASSWDEGRLLAIVTAAPSSELYLPYTVPLLLRQAETAGLGVDVILGLNHGYACPEVLARLAVLPGISMVHLKTTPKASRHAPGTVVRPGEADVFVPGAPSTAHRIFVVHQAAGAWTAGKMMMLLDLFSGFLVPSLERGWRAPRTTLEFDAEAIFVEHEPDAGFPDDVRRARNLLDAFGGRMAPAAQALIAEERLRGDPERDTFDIASPGLVRLMQEWRSEPLDVLGPATRFCAFNARKSLGGLAVDLPSPDDPISAMHQIYNEACGLLPGCGCISGAATLAGTEVLAGMLDVVLRRYAHIYGEDAIFTVLAEQTGLRVRLTRGVQFTNRCPSIDEPTTAPTAAWKTQFVKWYRGFEQIGALYGAEACGSVLGPGERDFLAAGLALVARQARRRGDAAALLGRIATCGAAFQEIRELARQEPSHR